MVITTPENLDKLGNGIVVTEDWKSHQKVENYNQLLAFAWDEDDNASKPELSM